MTNLEIDFVHFWVSFRKLAVFPQERTNEETEILNEVLLWILSEFIRLSDVCIDRKQLKLKI